jgi:hypothetical protein
LIDASQLEMHLPRLPAREHLTFLDISGNCDNPYRPIGRSAAVGLGRALAQLTSLEQLRLDKSVQQVGGRELTQRLAQLPRLSSIEAV